MIGNRALTVYYALTKSTFTETKYNVESRKTTAHLEKIAKQVNLAPASRSLKHIGENSKQAASVSC